MKPLHGFLQGDTKTNVEDVLHVLLGVLPIGLLLWAREWLWQWPPGWPFEVVKADGWRGFVTQLDRVSDSARDELGYRIGATLRNVGLVVWWAV